jgi:hypothetical protein
MSASQLVATRVRRLGAGAVALLSLAACSPDSPNAITPPTVPNLAAVGRQDDLGPALAAQAKHTGRLMADRELLGTGVGRLADGRPEVTVYARNAGAANRVPKELDGVPVTVEVTGDITALPAVTDPSPHARKPGGGAGSTSPTAFFARPVPIGVSTGRADECAAGTIGARVKSGSTVYALSNNHVYAKENAGKAGDLVYQPGRYDLNCGSDDTKYRLGTLVNATTISFTGDNVVDGAIVKPDNGTATLGNSTPSNGYGTPSSSITSAQLNMAVQKYGRTTGLTTGVVVGVNVIVNVQYDAGVARFVKQVEIQGTHGAFSKAGDSGSLIVTQSGRNPVALLFAGGQTVTFANPIADVLSALGVSIDGTP